MHFKRSLVLFFVFFALNVPQFLQAQNYTVAQIPDPKKNGGGYVSNPDKILSENDVAILNEKIKAIEQKNTAQIAVVVVNNFERNAEDFDFAFQIFKKWGIGQKGKNNGLLLFIAKEQRKYRFITGSGLEGDLPDVKLKHFAEQNLLPAFRENDFKGGIYNTLNAIEAKLTGVKNNTNNQASSSGIRPLPPEINEPVAESPPINSAYDYHVTTNKSITYIELNKEEAIAICLFIVAIFSLFNFFIAKAKKKLPKPNNPNQKEYDKFVVKGCGFLGLIILLSIFLMLFSRKFQSVFTSTQTTIFVFILFNAATFFRYVTHLNDLKKTYFDPKNLTDAISRFDKKMMWLVWFCPPILYFIIKNAIIKRKISIRLVTILDSKHKEMVRIDRDENPSGEPFLDEGQQKEEEIQSLQYDIWIGSGEEFKIVANNAYQHNNYTLCPSCKFKTYSKPFSTTIRRPTYAAKGLAKITRECKNCGFELFIRHEDIDKLVESSSSSNSSSSSSSFSSSSSSSSSWGGGSSSGGGTGGSW